MTSFGATDIVVKNTINAMNIQFNIQNQRTNLLPSEIIAANTKGIT